jgi:hypothetical protein
VNQNKSAIKEYKPVSRLGSNEIQLTKITVLDKDWNPSKNFHSARKMEPKTTPEKLLKKNRKSSLSDNRKVTTSSK